MLLIPLFTCAVALAQPGGSSEWLLTPRLARGQELTYRGSFVEEVTGPKVQYTGNYRLESRVFVLETPPTGTDLALLTILRLAAGSGQPGVEAASARIELTHADLQGRLTPGPAASLIVPLEGPPLCESGALVELPPGGIGVGKTWQVREPGRPPLVWQVTGIEAVSGTSCIKLVGLQQAPSWDQPRGDQAAWRRRETVWLNLRLGVAYRVERTVEHREPGRVEPTQRAVTRYELDNPLQYPGKLYEDRRREILLVRSLQDGIAPYLPEPGKYGTAPFDKVLARIKDHEDVQPPTPYREALDHLRRRVEAARRGESPPGAVSESAFAPQVATIGRRAPDFTVPDFLTRQSTSLRNWMGRPVVMVFYSPTSDTAEELLHFAQGVYETHRHEVAVLGLVVGDDVGRVRQQCSGLGITFPLLAGKGLRILYDVNATPKVVLLDAQGIVRASYTGWGREMPSAIREELGRWLGTRPLGEAAKPGR
jgi:peroxiredoxin